jgi:hypothetical protein
MCLIDDGVVLRGGLSRSVGVSAGLALEVPGVLVGVLLTNCRPVGTLAIVWLERGERQRQPVVVIRSAHRGIPTVTLNLPG